MIFVKDHGSFDKTENFLEKLRTKKIYDTLDTYARQGVAALASATPVDSGATAASWSYIIERGDGTTKIVWTNDNENRGVNIAVILQYGHGTGTGGYVQGRDYINPAIQPIMDQIAEGVWKEVTSA